LLRVTIAPEEDDLREQFLEREGERFDRLIRWSGRKDIGRLIAEMLVRGWKQPDETCERDISELALRVGIERTKRFPVYLMNDGCMTRCILEPIVTLGGAIPMGTGKVSELELALAFIGVRNWEVDPPAGKLIRFAIFIHEKRTDFPRSLDPRLVLAGWQSIHLVRSEVEDDPRQALDELVDKTNEPWTLMTPNPPWH